MKAAPHVLIVDDEPQIRRFLDIGYRAQGYRVALAANASEALAVLAQGDIDLVVLDLGLPDRDGSDLLRELRGWSDVPVIVLTARFAEEQKVALLDAGANDYVTKPFGVKELLARSRGLLRVHAVANTGPVLPVYDDGHLRVDLVRREVALDGASLDLSRKEYALLALLLTHAGRVVTQPQLLREIWGPTHERDTHYLRILVGKLRQKLGDDAAHPRWILTEAGVGLRFRA
ncbi:response regulator transcription factor [Thermomonas sp.]|uniref:response regulator n=1 Tax=Thermomonas sp. TaxID=1971895 RepID=UPI002489E623|nr:response regulator transcription factor [Thermomonas sp.]MDI1253163.1 response regulator transcription factor [Thermomonas sp.]